MFSASNYCGSTGNYGAVARCLFPPSVNVFALCLVISCLLFLCGLCSCEKKRCETPQTAGGLRVLLEDCEPDLWAGLIWNPSWVAGFDPSTGFPMQSWSKMKMFGIGASLGRGCPLFRHLFCYAQNLGEGSATLELWKGKLTTNVMKMAKKFWRLRVTLIVFLPTPPGVGGRGPGKKECQYLWRKKKSPTWGGVSQWLYDCLMAK